MMATDDDPGDLFEALAEVAPGAQFFGARQTTARSETAVFAPLVADGRSFGQWTEGWAKTATERANGLWKQVLAAFVPPVRDPAHVEAVADFGARRSSAGGAVPT